MQQAYIFTEEEMAKMRDTASFMYNILHNVETGAYTEADAYKALRPHVYRMGRALHGYIGGPV